MSTRYSKMSASENASSARADFGRSAVLVLSSAENRLDWITPLTVTVSTVSLLDASTTTGAMIGSAGATTTGESAISELAGGSACLLNAPSTSAPGVRATGGVSRIAAIVNSPTIV